MKQFEVRFVCIVDTDSDNPEDIYSEAVSLIEQGIGGFEYEEI